MFQRLTLGNSPPYSTSISNHHIHFYWNAHSKELEGIRVSCPEVHFGNRHLHILNSYIPLINLLDGVNKSS